MATPGRAVVIGEQLRIQGFALAGAQVLPAESPDAARAAWRELPDDVVLVVLTPAAAEALATQLHDSTSERLTVVMPT